MKSVIDETMKSVTHWISRSAGVLYNITGIPSLYCEMTPSQLCYRVCCSTLRLLNIRRQRAACTVADLLAWRALLMIYCNSLVKPLFNTGLLPSREPPLLRLLHWTTILCLIDLWIIYTLIPAAIPGDSQPLSVSPALPFPTQPGEGVRLSVSMALGYLFITASSLPLCLRLCAAEDDGTDS